MALIGKVKAQIQETKGVKYPSDTEIKNEYLKTVELYNKGDNWNLRITADALNCPIDYVRNVLNELYEKGEL